MKRNCWKSCLCQLCYCHPKLNCWLLCMKNSFEEVCRILNSDYCGHK